MPKVRAASQNQDESVGARIAAQRKARGITQVELADELGVTQGGLSKYERGELRLHTELLIKLAELLSLSVDELLGVRAPSAASSVPTIRDARLRRRLHQIDRLSKRDREALVRTIDAFLTKGKSA